MAGGPSGAAKTVLITGGLMTAAVMATSSKASWSSGRTFKQIWGVGVTTLILSVFADVAPQLVVPLAVAILIAFVMVHPDTFALLTRAKTAAAGSSSSPPATPNLPGPGSGGSGGSGGGGGFG